MSQKVQSSAQKRAAAQDAQRADASAPSAQHGPVAASDNSAAAQDAQVLDLAIVGAGPAALTAALYAARAGLSVRAFGRDSLGGALTEISHIANFPGFDGAGSALAQALLAQARAAGAVVQYGDCTSLAPDRAASLFRLTVDAEPVLARAVLVATGSEPRPLGLDLQVPVSYCALCDGDLIHGRRVAVVGGGNSAVQEAFYLAKLADSVTLVVRSSLRADHALRARLVAAPNITVLEQTPATAELLNTFDHVFVYIGKRPATSFLAAPASDDLLDADGYIITPPAMHSTAIPGLFAAGDVRSGAVRQAITAAGDGAAAAVEISAFLQSAAKTSSSQPASGPSSRTAPASSSSQSAPDSSASRSASSSNSPA